MSRYYDIQIFQPNSTQIFREYTSFPKVGNSNQNDPGALNVIIDAFVYNFDTPMAQPFIQIWGVPIADVMQASNFTGCTIKVFGGFQKGFPLNNPNQSGGLFEGKIFQSFGNWQGTDMTLDLVVVYDGALAGQDANISFNWLANTPLSQALATTLTNAFPGVAQTINISSNLVLNHDVPGHYTSLTAFCQMLKPLTQSILGGSYPGVSIARTTAGFVVQDAGAAPPKAVATPIPTFTVDGMTFPVTNGSITVPAALLNNTQFINSLPSPVTLDTSPSDKAANVANGTVTFLGVTPNGTSTSPTPATSPPATMPTSPPVQIAFQDLIGQPTWIGPQTIQFMCPMRADLTVNQVVTMPKGILGNPANPAGSPGAVITTAAASPSQRQTSGFTGNFQIVSIHHVGNFRDPNGIAWATIIDANVQLAQASAPTGGGTP